ncbi:hypothetical protein N8083_00575 [Candidatus Pacebacteria bacterium]|nr:hypothetical protein [Candidatus Paceibacterota bacterium]
MKYKLSIIVSSVVIAGAVVILSIYFGIQSEVFNATENTHTKVYEDATSSSQITKQEYNESPESFATSTDNEATSSNQAIKKEYPETAESFSTTDSEKFVENFDIAYTVKEAGNMNESNNEHWWLSSGGYFYNKEGVGSTIAGNLSEMDPRRIAHAASNALDTDDGYHPQNIFRLVLRSTWKDFQQEAYFKVVNDNLSASPYRNESNGLLFFNRYQDAFNLYYTGIRVDGYATIKKKINGTYYTLAYEPFNTFTNPYDRDTNPNLLPKQQWVGMRSEIETNSDNTVSIKLYIDETKTGNWVLVAEAIDDGISYGGPVFDEGHAGIRTDFMDVEFDNYSIKSRL